MSKELLFSVTKDDFTIQTFKSGGPGGQNQNKVNSGVRLIHKASGAIGESREFRDQIQNKKSAFMKLIKTPKFVAWYNLEISRKLGKLEDIEKKVDKMMSPENIKVEYF